VTAIASVATTNTIATSSAHWNAGAHAVGRDPGTWRKRTWKNTTPGGGDADRGAAEPGRDDDQSGGDQRAAEPVHDPVHCLSCTSGSSNATTPAPRRRTPIGSRVLRAGLSSGRPGSHMRPSTSATMPIGTLM
jgi:hypothetical protein